MKQFTEEEIAAYKRRHPIQCLLDDMRIKLTFLLLKSAHLRELPAWKYYIDCLIKAKTV